MATQLLNKVRNLVSRVGNGMEDSEIEGEDTSLVKCGVERAVTVRLERSGRDSETWKRKDKVTAYGWSEGEGDKPG